MTQTKIPVHNPDESSHPPPGLVTSPEPSGGHTSSSCCAKLGSVATDILGVTLGLLSGLIMSLSGLAVQHVSTMSPMQLNGVRSSLAAFIVLVIIFLFRPSQKSINWKQGFEVFIVSIVFSIKFTTFVVGSTLLPLSNFSLLCNTVPLFTAILGCFCLSEVCGLREILSCLVVMAGVLTTFVPDIIYTGSSGSNYYVVHGYLVTMLFSFSTGVVLCWLRRLKDVHSLYITFYAAAVTGAMCLLIAHFTEGLLLPTNLIDAALTVFLGICQLLQSLLPAVACSLTQASKVAVAMTFSVVFSFIIQSAQDKALPSIYSIVGGVLIMVAVVIGNSPIKVLSPAAESETSSSASQRRLSKTESSQA